PIPSCASITLALRSVMRHHLPPTALALGIGFVATAATNRRIVAERNAPSANTIVAPGVKLRLDACKDGIRRRAQHVLDCGAISYVRELDDTTNTKNHNSTKGRFQGERNKDRS